MQNLSSYTGKGTGNVNQGNPSYGQVHYVSKNYSSASETTKDALKISFCHTARYLEAVWQRPVNNLEYRHYIRFIGVCIALLKVKYVLVDFTRFGNPTLVDQKSTAEFLQKALTNTTLLRSARVLSGDASQLQTYKAIVQDGPVLPYEIKVFHDAREGREWLFQKPVQHINTTDSILIPVDCNHKTLRKLVASEAAAEGNAKSQADGQLKSDITFRTDYLEIKINKDKSLLALKWLRNITSREFRYGILKSARALFEHQVKLLLINNQRGGVLTLEDQAWFVSNSVAVLSKSYLEKLAVINSADAIQQMTSEAIDARIKKANLRFASRLFLSEAEANGWLLTPDLA